ncbi:hypothetical protein ASD76_17365 [Altererythrobacter sp. Root672]|nr:hypothetical protein ASD76_17365 [Altererythrobacter sp. Root672]
MAIRLQIRHADKLENKRLMRLHRAKRFVLPLTLSTATHYANEVIRSLSEASAILRSTPNGRLSGHWSPPVFPSEIPVSLGEFVETSDVETVNALVSELLRQIQILNARLVSLIADEDVFRLGINMNIAEYQLQAAKIRQLCGALFPYARGQSEDVPTELERGPVVSSLRFNGTAAPDDDFESVIERFQSVGKPWWTANDDR